MASFSELVKTDLGNSLVVFEFVLWFFINTGPELSLSLWQFKIWILKKNISSKDEMINSAVHSILIRRRASMLCNFCSISDLLLNKRLDLLCHFNNAIWGVDFRLRIFPSDVMVTLGEMNSFEVRLSWPKVFRFHFRTRTEASATFTVVVEKSPTANCPTHGFWNPHWWTWRPRFCAGFLLISRTGDSHIKGINISSSAGWRICGCGFDKRCLDIQEEAWRDKDCHIPPNSLTYPSNELIDDKWFALQTQGPYWFCAPHSNLISSWVSLKIHTNQIKLTCYTGITVVIFEDL